MTWENKISPLFWDIQTPSESIQTPSNPLVSDKAESILSSLNFGDTSETLPELPDTSSSQTSSQEPIATSVWEQISSLHIWESVPVQNPDSIAKLSSSIAEKIPLTLPRETLDVDHPKEAETVTVPKQPDIDPKLSQYLRADTVYQDMIRVEDFEKIRLKMAVRYTLLMFAIFLVFAWIVSNRIIMFGFSEFIWLARIRDGLFAVMAGLFSLTLWFGSASWSRHTFLLALFRTLAITFFVIIIIALYIPLK
jgi:hypothetical protein